MRDSEGMKKPRDSGDGGQDIRERTSIYPRGCAKTRAKSMPRSAAPRTSSTCMSFHLNFCLVLFYRNLIPPAIANQLSCTSRTVSQSRANDPMIRGREARYLRHRQLCYRGGQTVSDIKLTLRLPSPSFLHPLNFI